MVQAQHVARDGRPGRAVLGQLALHVGHHGGLDLVLAERARPAAQKALVPRGHDPGVVVGLAAEHHAIHLLQVRGDLLVAGHAAIEHDGQLRKLLLEAVDHLVAQRRDLAVLLRAQALEPGVARVHDEHAAAGLGHGADEVAHEGVALFAVDADAVLHRHRQVHGVRHGLHAVGHQARLGHQAGPEGAALHALAGAAAVEVDLVVAPALADGGAARQIGRLAAAQLQRHRVLAGVHAQVAALATVQQAAGGDHLGVQARLFGQQPVQVAAVLVGPVDHRRDGQAPGADRGLGAKGFRHGAIIPAGALARRRGTLLAAAPAPARRKKPRRSGALRASVGLSPCADRRCRKSLRRW